MPHWLVISILKARRRTGGRRRPVRRRRRAKAPKVSSLLLASFEWVLVYDPL
jgi:hypothetical protein